MANQCWEQTSAAITSAKCVDGRRARHVHEHRRRLGLVAQALLEVVDRGVVERGVQDDRRVAHLVEVVGAVLREAAARSRPGAPTPGRGRASRGRRPSPRAGRPGRRTAAWCRGPSCARPTGRRGGGCDSPLRHDAEHRRAVVREPGAEHVGAARRAAAHRGAGRLTTRGVTPRPACGVPLRSTSRGTRRAPRGTPSATPSGARRTRRHPSAPPVRG